MATYNQKYKVEEIIAAIEGSGGIKTTIAKRLGCHRHTVDAYLGRFATARQAYYNETEKIDDLAESVVIKSIQEGNTNDAKWWLERRRRDRFARKETTENLNIDVTDLTDDQLQRIANGESPTTVLADQGEG